MIGRADIEGSKSNIPMNAWLPQASYPCGNFSDTSSRTHRGSKGSIGHAFTVGTHTEGPNQGGVCPFALHEISVLVEPPFGHLRYCLTDVPPQPNSPSDNVSDQGHPIRGLTLQVCLRSPPPPRIGGAPWRERDFTVEASFSRLFYTLHVTPQCLT